MSVAKMTFYKNNIPLQNCSYNIFHNLLSSFKTTELTPMFTKKTLSLFLILLIGFIDLMGLGLVYPMFASMLYQGDCHLLADDASETVRGACLGLLLAAMPITQFFSAPILGILSDQKGRRKILIPALGVGVIGYLIAMVGVYTENILFLFLSRVCVGISAGTAAIVGAALADISSQEEKAKKFGLFNMACGLGFTVGPFVGGILSGKSFGFLGGYVLPFAVAGGVVFINMIFVALFFEETYILKEKTKLSLGLGIRNIRKALEIKGLQVIFLAVFLACVGWSFYWEFTPVTWISSFGFSTATIGNFYAYGAAVYAITCGLLIGPLVSRFNNQHLLCYALFGCAISIGILLIHENALWLWLYIPLQQFFIALFWPTAAAVVSNSVGEDIQGEILGVLQSVDALAFAISPLIAGPLLGLSASMPIVIGCTGMLIATFVLALFLKKTPYRNKPAALMH